MSKNPRQITLWFTACDGWRKTSKFKTLEGAQKAAHARLGAHPEMGGSYAVAGDGVVKVEVAGATLVELFPERQDVRPLEVDMEGDVDDEGGRRRYEAGGTSRGTDGYDEQEGP